jgi:hypothetical protein
MRTVIKMSAAAVAAAILLGMFCHGMLNCCLAAEPMATKPITSEELAKYAANCTRHSGPAIKNPAVGP